MKKEELIINVNDRKLYGILQMPEIPDKNEEKKRLPAVIMMHCFMGSTRENSFYELSRMFLSHGAAVLRFDFTGHGRSDGELTDMTFKTLNEDAEAVFRYLRTREDISGIYLLGHSIGGLIATFLAAGHPDDIRALMLLAPAANARAAAESGLLFNIPFDPSDPPECIEDPSTGVRLCREYIKESLVLDIFDAPGNFRGPVLGISGDADRRVPSEYVRRYSDTYHDFEFRSIPGLDHLFYPDTAELIRAVEDFFIRHFDPQSYFLNTDVQQ